VSLEIEAVASPDALEALEPEWRELWERDEAATPFEGPDWLLPWTRHLWGGGSLRVLAVRRGRELVGLAPLFLWGYGTQPETVCASWLGSGISDHLGMLAAPESAGEAAQRVIEWLADSRCEWRVCDLQEVRPDSPLLRAELPPGLAAQDAPCGVCPVLDLPRTMDDLLASLDPKFRHNLRTAGRRLQLGARVEVIRAAADWEPLLRELFRLHESRWRERGERGMLASPRLERFHREAAERMARSGALRLYGLKRDGETIAVQYNFRRGRRFFYYLSGFDPAHAHLSPGTVLLAETIRLAIDEGATEIDFLRKREDFKYRWGARDRVNRRLWIEQRAARAENVA